MLGLLMAAGCTDGEAVEHADQVSEEAEPALGALEVLPTDTLLKAVKGHGSGARPVVGTFGPIYHVYAKCGGGGRLKIFDDKSDYHWLVRCNNVPNRNQVINETKQSLKLRVKANPETRWELLIAEPKR